MSSSRALQNFQQEFIDSLQLFHSQLLECRPSDPLDFAVTL